MVSPTALLLTLLFFVTALLYAAVGLGGGTGYLAVMGLVGVPPEVMRPASLALNILVAAIGTWTHVRAGQFAPRLFWPLALASVPLAFIGGRLTLAGDWYRPLVALVLIASAVRLWLSTREGDSAEPTAKRVLPLWLVALIGGGVGLLSGMLGMGGGVLVGPLLLLTDSAETRETFGVTAAFVLVNSIAGLVGQFSVMAALPSEMPLWLLAAGAGGWVGAQMGSERLNPLLLRKLLAGVLLLSGLRLIWTTLG